MLASKFSTEYFKMPSEIIDDFVVIKEKAKNPPLSEFEVDFFRKNANQIIKKNETVKSLMRMYPEFGK